MPPPAAMTRQTRRIRAPPAGRSRPYSGPLSRPMALASAASWVATTSPAPARCAASSPRVTSAAVSASRSAVGSSARIRRGAPMQGAGQRQPPRLAARKAGAALAQPGLQARRAGRRADARRRPSASAGARSPGRPMRRLAAQACRPGNAPPAASSPGRRARHRHCVNIR
jgi:hypothetical protein